MLKPANASSGSFWKPAFLACAFKYPFFPTIGLQFKKQTDYFFHIVITNYDFFFKLSIHIKLSLCNLCLVGLHQSPIRFIFGKRLTKPLSQLPEGNPSWRRKKAVLDTSWNVL